MTGVIKRIQRPDTTTAAASAGPFWDDTRQRIDDGAVTPIVSNQVTAALFGVQPGELAQEWAKDLRSPLSEQENRDLARVAQFRAVRLKNPAEAKRQYLEALKGYFLGAIQDAPDTDGDLFERYMDEARRRKASFSALAREFGYPRFNQVTDNSLRLLAELPLPIYVTTCHHRFLEFALEDTGARHPETEILYWRDGLESIRKDIGSIFAREPDYTPSFERPLVYHLYGLDEYPGSLVLTEDDYLDYLVKLSSLSHEVKHAQSELDIPDCVSMALSGTALLLLGYDVYDWDFRVLFRGLIQPTAQSRHQLTGNSIAMQLDPVAGEDAAARRDEIRAYLDQFFEESHFNIYWGDMRSCVSEVWQLWKGG